MKRCFCIDIIDGIMPRKDGMVRKAQIRFDDSVGLADK